MKKSIKNANHNAVIIVKAKFAVENGKHKGKPVYDFYSNKFYASAMEAFLEAGLKKYVTFTWQLRNGKPNDDGHVRCYVEDMAYYANHIQYINAERNRLEYEKKQAQKEAIEKEMELLKGRF